MSFQESVNSIIGSVGRAVAIPKLVKGVNEDDQVSPERKKLEEDKLKYEKSKLLQKKRELRAHTKQWKAKQAIRAEAEADMQSRLEEKKQLRQKTSQLSVSLGTEQLNPKSDLYNLLIKAGEKNGEK